MSLINEMLQDLEQRRAPISEASGVPRYVRVLPIARRSRWAWRLLVGAAACAAAAAMIWSLNDRAAARPSPAAHLAAAVVPVGSALTQAAMSSQSVSATASPALTSGVPAASVIAADSATGITSERPRADADSQPGATRTGEEAQQGSALSGLGDAIKLSLRMDMASSPSIAASKPVSKGLSGAAQSTPDTPHIARKLRDLTPPEQAENEYRLGATLLNQGRLADAAERFSAALRLSPRHTAARHALFGLLLQAKRTTEAEQLLEEALKTEPAQPGFAMAVARLQAERGDNAAALQTLQNAVQVSRSNADYLAFFAALLQREGRHAQAIEYYESALALAPRSGLWLLGLGMSLQAMNRTTEAQEAFRRARTSDGLTPELQAFADQRLRQLH
jgi:MSHA biogenesis protein MshN